MPFRRITDPQRLQALVGAMLLIEEGLDLPTVLDSIVRRAVELAGARYGALGVLDSKREGLSQFITAGIDPERLVEEVGPEPDGEGVLAVPVKVQGEEFGNLYLCDKQDGEQFTEVDCDVVSALALAAGLAIDKARLYARLRELTLSEERERIARNLHDTVIQRLFAVGLMLQSATRLPGRAESQERVHSAVDDLDETIRQIRSTIFAISRPRHVTGRGVRAEILDLTDEAAGRLGLDARVDFEGPIDTTVDHESAEHLLVSLREAISNVVRHACASAIEVEVKVERDDLTLRVTDDGVGLDPELAQAGGRGLSNLAERAKLLGGTCEVLPAAPTGTELIWCVKLAR